MINQLRVEELLNFDDDQKLKMERLSAKGLMEIVPVALPEGENLLGNNDHFGWPVAARSGEAMVVAYHRTPQHWGDTDLPDEHTSHAVLTRSLDSGKTWSGPVDLKIVAQPAVSGCRLGFGNSIGTLADGTLVLVTPYGVFHSKDQGASWIHIPDAFGNKQLRGPVTNNGPCIGVHPDFGLIVPGHADAGTNPDGTEKIADQIWLRSSINGGVTWSEEVQHLPDWVKPVEPTILVWKRSLIMLARCHGGYDPETRTWRYVQLYSRTGWLPLQFQLTNIRTSDTQETTHNPYHGPWSQDTVDIAVNPLNNRIEAVVTNRDGGGPGREHIHTHMTLNLWSIDPESLLAGDSHWRFEGTLLTRRGTHVSGVDGMHPGASVIDERLGLQHIFIYLGYPQGPSGIFCLRRSLHTARLGAGLNG